MTHAAKPLPVQDFTQTFPVKHCPRCTRDKPLDEFGVDRARADGRTPWCMLCRAADARSRRRNRTPSERQLDATRFRARYRAEPEKWKAKVAVARAVAAGKLTKPAKCERCGNEHRRLEARHTAGYERENWLVVEWCCRSCGRLG